MSTRDENIRLRIEAVSDLPIVADQYLELIRLTRLHTETMQQSAQLIRAAIAEEGAAVRAQTAEYKSQEAAQKAASAAARAAAKEQADEVKRQTTAQQALAAAERETATAARAAAIAQRADIKGIGDEFNKSGDSVRNFTTLLAAAFTLDKIKSFGGDVIDAKTKVDSLGIALTTMLGSRREADDLYAKVVALAKNTPFTLEEVGDQVAKLKAYNIATEDLIPTITALGNMAAAVGKEKLPQLTLAYGQIANTGKLMGTELKQLTEAGIPVFDLLAASMGKTKEAVIELQSAHAITFADIRKAFMMASEEGGKYAGLMANVSKTVGGQISNLGDAYQIAKARIGNFFEDQIRSGTKYMGELIETLIGSESAIKRTSLAIASAVTVFGTLRVATTAQALATAGMTAAQSAAALASGTYNLIMLTLKGTTEGLTRAQLESAVAARSSFAAIAANPIGAFVTVVGLATAGVLAWKAAQEDISVTMGEQEFSLRKGRDEINRLVESATNLKETDVRRKGAIQELIAKYPEYFSGLNTEKVSNDQLRAILDNVNNSYTTRIALAKEAYNAEKLQENRRKLWDDEAEAIARLTQRLPELKQFGTDTGKMLDYLNNDIVKFRQAQGGGNAKSILDNVVNGNPVDLFLTTKKSLETIETEIKASDERIRATTAKGRAIDISNTKEHYADLIKAAGSNKTEIAKLKQEEADVIAKINGTYKAADLVDTTDHEEKKKQISLLSAKQLAVITRGLLAETVEERIKALDAQQAAEIESINKITISRKASDGQIAALREDAEKKITAIVVKNQAIRDVLEKEAQEIKHQQYVERSRETEDKITLLKTQQLEAQKALDKLNAAETYEERLIIFREYGSKISDEIKIQAVEELRIQRDASLKRVEEIRGDKGVLSQAYRDAHAQYLKDEKEYNTAVLALTKETTQSKLKEIEDAEKRIQKAHEETHDNEKKLLEVQKKNRGELLGFLSDFLGKEFGLLGQIGQAVISVGTNWDQLSGKAVKLAEEQKTWYDAMANNLKLVDDGSAKSAAAIAEAEANASAAGVKLEETKGASIMAALGVVNTIYQVLSAVAGAINQALMATYQAVADSLGRTREVYAEFNQLIRESNKEALDFSLKLYEDDFAKRGELIRAYYAEERALVTDAGRIDAELAYHQQVAQAAADAGGNAKKFIEGMLQAQKDYAVAQQQLVIETAEVNRREAEALMNDNIAKYEAQLQAFKESKDKELAILEENLAKQKAATEQFYSDKQLRLQEDDAYRAILLAQGEAREVAELEAAKQREIARAIQAKATAEEIEQITTAFNKLIADKHAEYQTAIGNKTKEVALANGEVKAQEKDKTNALEADAKVKTNAIQEQILQKEREVALLKSQANAEYATALNSYNRSVFEANKQMKLAELEADKAVLLSKRWFMNKNKINEALGYIDEAISKISGTSYSSGPIDTGPTAPLPVSYVLDGVEADKPYSGTVPYFDSAGNAAEISYTPNNKIITVYDANGKPVQIANADAFIPATGQRFFLGSPYVELGGNPAGRDTIPAMVNEGERIMSTADNIAIGGRDLSNGQLVEKVKAYDVFVEQHPELFKGSAYDKFAAEFPRLLDPNRWSDIADTRMNLPQSVMVDGMYNNTLELREMISEVKGLRTDILNKKYVEINMDEKGFTKSIIGVQSKINHIESLFRR